MRFRDGFMIGLATAALAVGTAQAHHSFSMFDLNKRVTWVGTVKEYSWRNPHTRILIDVPKTSKDPTQAGTWDIEGASIAIMSRQGWNKSSLRPGDKITIVGHPLRNGEKGASLFYAIDKSGRRLYHDTAR